MGGTECLRELCQVGLRSVRRSYLATAAAASFLALAAFSFWIYSTSNFSFVASTRSTSCFSFVALAIGAVIPG